MLENNKEIFNFFNKKDEIQEKEIFKIFQNLLEGKYDNDLKFGNKETYNFLTELIYVLIEHDIYKKIIEVEFKFSDEITNYMLNFLKNNKDVNALEFFIILLLYNKNLKNIVLDLLRTSDKRLFVLNKEKIFEKFANFFFFDILNNFNNYDYLYDLFINRTFYENLNIENRKNFFKIFLLDLIFEYSKNRKNFKMYYINKNFFKLLIEEYIYMLSIDLKNYKFYIKSLNYLDGFVFLTEEEFIQYIRIIDKCEFNFKNNLIKDLFWLYNSDKNMKMLFSFDELLTKIKNNRNNYYYYIFLYLFSLLKEKNLDNTENFKKLQKKALLNGIDLKKFFIKFDIDLNPLFEVSFFEIKYLTLIAINKNLFVREYYKTLFCVSCKMLLKQNKLFKDELLNSKIINLEQTENERLRMYLLSIINKKYEIIEEEIEKDIINCLIQKL